MSRQHDMTWSRTGNQKTPNCDCGGRLSANTGVICDRCGCLHCGRCTFRAGTAAVCDGCLIEPERSRMKYPRWNKRP